MRTATLKKRSRLPKSSASRSPEKEALAIRGGAPAVKAPAPASYLHGPQEIGKEEIRAVTAALKTKNLFRFFKEEKDSPTACFEKLFCEKSGAKHCLAVNSGTSALISALVGIGVSTGDEVLVPAYTYIASAASILAVRAFPVIVEVDDSLTMDPKDAALKITPRTRAIMPVHMRGVPCRMEELVALARRHNLKIIEDCAQANGANYRGRPVGSIGDVGAFSLQHFKIITAGEGGAVITSDKTVFERAGCYHDSAYSFWKSKDWGIAPFLGENYRMSDLNGALAFEQLKKRDRILTRMRSIKARWVDSVSKLPGITLQDVPDPEGDASVSLVLFTETPQRTKAFAEALRAEGMSAGSMFDKGFPDRHIYYHWDYIMEKRSPDLYGHPWNDGARPCQVKYSRDMCPRSLEWLNRAVAIPITQAMTDAHVKDCARAIAKVANGL